MRACVACMRACVCDVGVCVMYRVILFINTAGTTKHKLFVLLYHRICTAMHMENQPLDKATCGTFSNGCTNAS